MKKQTYEEKIIKFFGENVGYANGLPSTRNGSNLRTEFNRIHEETGCKEVYAIAGAHRRHATDGWKWYVYTGVEKKGFENMRRIVRFEYNED